MTCFFSSNTYSDIKTVFRNIWLIESMKNDKLIITKNRSDKVEVNLEGKSKKPDRISLVRPIGLLGPHSEEAT